MEEKKLLTSEQYGLVITWLSNQKFRDTIGEYNLNLLYSIVKDDRIPDQIDRNILNNIRKSWIKFLT